MSRVLISFIISVILIGCSQQKYLTSKWEKPSYQLMDSIPLWDYQYSKKSKLFYLVTNDSSNLYIHLKALDATSQKKILMFGFQTWIDTTAKNKKQMSVRFPLPANERMTANSAETQPKRERRDFDLYKKRTLDQLMQMELLGFESENSSRFIYANNKNHINGQMQVNKDGDLLYLLIIPFKSIGLEYKPELLLSLNLKSGHLSESLQQGGAGARQGRAAGGKSGQMGGGPPNGMQGRGNPQMGQQNRQGKMQARMQERQELTTPIKIQLKKIKLL